jgi:hypothetical protein
MSNGAAFAFEVDFRRAPEDTEALGAKRFQPCSIVTKCNRM